MTGADWTRAQALRWRRERDEARAALAEVAAFADRYGGDYRMERVKDIASAPITHPIERLNTADVRATLDEGTA